MFYGVQKWSVTLPAQNRTQSSVGKDEDGVGDTVRRGQIDKTNKQANRQG